ncbi:hypothetical protein PNK_0844 [Candidatus Protochlamydia naegleriophila]|uniref:Uncharacterized protein n=1 Tax=Candidatus Protochlamydia naegleriophila TaxID=389348 RepID=A0A0U5JF02_9BACT|nr:hypothetical protein [Candidatus Protochlamydia naegleriophila]CUI16469.1 hypothetical protein PNK_0844 [Candidatus Protochlamydia naegleriophila]
MVSLGVSYMVSDPLSKANFQQQVDSLSAKIETLENKCKQNANAVTKTDIIDIIRDLERINETIDTDVLENRKLVLAQGKQINERIAQALNTFFTYHKTQPSTVAQKNIGELIASLFAKLNTEMVSDETVKNLKEKWKAFSQKIQESGKSKQA